MKRIFTFLLTLTLLCALLPLHAGASGEGWYMVQSNSGYTYLYTNASDRDEISRNLGRYNNGDLVYVLDYYGGQDGKYNYCHVQTQDEKTGYMHDGALTPYYGTPAATSAAGWYEVSSTYTYLYSKASDRDEISRNLGRYNRGEHVFVLDYYGGQDGKYNYCHVQTQDGKTGYMHDGALRRFYGSVAEEGGTGWHTVESTSPRGYTYLYSKASDRDAISRNLGRYNNGELVYVLEYYGGQDGKYNYCHVQTQDGKTGYMHDYSLTPYTGRDPSIRLSTLPKLTRQTTGIVIGSDASVYTGPSSSYYRTSSGKAYVASGETLTVYGRESDHYLIQYSGVSGGEAVTRWSFIPASRLRVNGYVNELSYDWTPITISDDAHLADAPDWRHGYNTISVDRSNAFALAQFVDANGTPWVYFESLGYSSVSGSKGYMTVRGFVPMNEVSLR